ncbi:hypothetical protein ACFFGR_09515 [Arthrobacter liuii]|uniref:Uncharacterized protein n=1 Tax=Arthrobacter liuii TaxID=1476996 RepID=A0ABQ2APF5_9MICC|nr:hypothetical protein [Arthrobacter liuii]GGH93955.1 hypothetical protein GCM10007170_16030 [Arthrobacter liuii]
MTYLEALRHAVHAIIDADLTAAETRTAVTSLIPKEHHVIHHQR